MRLPFAAFTLSSLAATALLLGLAAEPLRAQRILDRVERILENQVLPRLDAATAPGGPLGQGVATPGGVPPAGANPVALEAGYFGVVADDSETAGRGARVTGLRTRGPAETAGLRTGDLIYAINGRSVRNLEAMGQALANLPVGARVEVFFERDGKRMATNVTLGQRPDAAAVAPGAGPALQPPQDPVRVARPAYPTTPPVLGVRAVTIPDAARLGYALFARRGAVLTSIEVGSVADRAGLALGNVIVSLNGVPVNDPAALSTAMRTVRWGDEVDLQFYRGDRLLQQRIVIAPQGNAAGALSGGAIPGEDRPLVLGPKINEFPVPGAPTDPSRIPPPDPRPTSELPAPPPPRANPPLPVEGAGVPPSIDELERAITPPAPANPPLLPPQPGPGPAPNLVELPTPERVRQQIAGLEEQLQKLKTESAQVEARLAELRKMLEEVSKPPLLPPDPK